MAENLSCSNGAPDSLDGTEYRDRPRLADVLRRSNFGKNRNAGNEQVRGYAHAQRLGEEARKEFNCRIRQELQLRWSPATNASGPPISHKLNGFLPTGPFQEKAGPPGTAALYPKCGGQLLAQDRGSTLETSMKRTPGQAHQVCMQYGLVVMDPW